MCLITRFADLVATGFIEALNFIIVGLGALIVGLVALMPTMPSFPAALTGSFAWLNYFVPVSSFIALIGTGITLTIAWIAIRIALNWLKAI
jgi:hypothetical protein